MIRTACVLIPVLALGWGTAESPHATPALGVVADDACVFKPMFTNGRRFVYAYTNTTHVLPAKEGATAQPPDAAAGEAGPTAEEPLRAYMISMRLRLTVLGTDEKGGASLAMLPDDIEVTTVDPDLERNAGFTRVQAEAEKPVPDGASFLPRVALALARSAARVDVRPDGTIAEVTGLEDVYEMAAKEGAEGSNVLGPFAPNSIKRTLATLFRVDVPGPDAGFPERKAGDTWTIVDRIPSMGGAEVVSTLALTLKTCTPEIAEIGGAAVISIEPAGGEDAPKPNPAQPLPTVDEQSDALTIVWDAQKRAVKKRERDTLLAVSARVGAARINPMRLRTRSTVELVEVSE